jgi:hypothetical protein
MDDLVYKNVSLVRTSTCNHYCYLLLFYFIFLAPSVSCPKLNSECCVLVENLIDLKHCQNVSNSKNVK